MLPLEQTLNGGYPGLYGEVVTYDCYHLRQLDFVPDLVLDIGANVGVFSRFARELWPAARIIAFEPNPENGEVFRHYTPNCLLIPVALGIGPRVFRQLGAVNGSGECYLSPSPGYPVEMLQASMNSVPDTVGVWTLDLIYSTYWSRGDKTVLKVDIEGAENCLWQDPASMGRLARTDYITMELHDYGMTPQHAEVAKQATLEGLERLGATHQIGRDGVYMWARKKNQE